MFCIKYFTLVLQIALKTSMSVLPTQSLSKWIV